MKVVQKVDLRPYAGESDIADIVRIENAEYEADSLPGRVEVGGMRGQFAHVTPEYDAARDVTLALVDGVVVAVASRGWRDNNDGESREYRVDGHVHPDWRRRQHCFW